MLAAALLGGVVGGALGGGWGGEPDLRRSTAVPWEVADPAPPATAVLSAPEIRPSREERTPGIPTRLRVPALDLDLSVRPQGVDAAGAMALPGSVEVAGWYRYGAAPGASYGAAVIAGHVDTAEEGTGPLARLVGLRRGARVAVSTTRGVVEYAVASVSEVPRAELDLDQLFARGGPARLHLVTCGGAYLPEAGGYQANVVVVGLPVDDGGGRGRGIS